MVRFLLDDLVDLLLFDDAMEAESEVEDGIK
jgi:hypothetical protein